MLMLLLACLAPDGSDLAAPIGPPCEAIVGTHAVVVVSSTDPSQFSVPQGPPTEHATEAVSLAGPDSEGRIYLAEHSGRLLRSPDGCTWDEVGRLPEALERVNQDTGFEERRSYDATLLVDPGSDVVHLLGKGDELYVSRDGGATFDLLPGSLAPRGLAMDPNDRDRVRFVGLVESIWGLWTSDDAGATWSSSPTIPPNGAAVFQPGDLDTIAMSANGLWLTTDGGAHWAKVIDDNDVQGPVAWDDTAIVARWLETVGDPSAPTNAVVTRRTEDLGNTFVDLPVNDDPDFYVRGMGSSAGTLVSGGFVGSSGQARIEITTPTHTTLHHLAAYSGNVWGLAMLDDRAVFAFNGHD